MGDNLRHTVDAFIQAVEDARRQLIREEGQDVSVRELIRRAGFTDSQRAGVAYHLNPRIDRAKGHRVPPEIVRKLAAVLPVSEEDLMRSAQVAAGLQVSASAHSDVALMVARFLGDEEVSEQEREEVADRILEVILQERRKRRGR